MFTLASKIALALIPAALALPAALGSGEEVSPLPLTPVSIVIPTDTSSEPQLFIDEAGQFFAREKIMSEFAIQRSSNVQVQAYARQIMDRHTRLELELNNIVRQVHAAPPRERLFQIEVAARLGGLQGADFDRAYISASVSDHQAAMANFQNQGLARDPRGINLKPLSDWAAQTVSSLNDELTKAQALSESLGTRDKTPQEP